MAVILQRVVGGAHGERFYPDFSGVVRSRNFYPVPPMASEDGIAAVALGMGREVVEGGKCMTFCPRYPRNLVQFSSVKDILTNSQSEFWAMEMIRTSIPIKDVRTRNDPRSFDRAEGCEAWTGHPICADARGAMGRCDAAEAIDADFSRDNDAVYDGMSRPGARIVSFAPVLKQGVFPLAPILEQLARVGEEALGQPVEIEFAVSLPAQVGEAAEFGFLQIRPLVLSREGEELRMGDVDAADLVCRSSMVLGNGRIQNLHDVVVVDFHRFERGRSQRGGGVGGLLQYQARAGESSLSVSGRGAAGIERSVAGDSGGVGSRFRERA